MFSSVGCPALVPILMPGGIGRIVAEMEPADANNAAPPIAALANSRLAGLEGTCDSGLLMLKLRSDGYLNVGLRRPKVGKISHNPREPGPRASVVQVVRRVGRRDIRILMRQIVAVQPETEFQALTRG